MKDCLPPHPRPPNESAGFLGDYCCNHLDEVFDLVDIDGVWPAIWIYRKRDTRCIRLYEEKLRGQKIRKSQHHVWPELIRRGIDIYVIWEAERLAALDFPISVSKIGTHGSVARRRDFDRATFDNWLIDGICGRAAA